MIKRALISVTDKTNLHKLAPFLIERNVEIISTGGTLKYLKQHGIKATEISEFTQFPEMMGGRLKTLHPKVHGGILGRRGVDDQVMSDFDIRPIDLVVVNLYNFEETISKSGSTLEDAIENIDIGGPAMLRSAAKNFKDVIVLCNPQEYDSFIWTYQSANGELSERDRLHFAQQAFAHTAQYDTNIAQYLYFTLAKQLIK